MLSAQPNPRTSAPSAAATSTSTTAPTLPTRPTSPRAPDGTLRLRGGPIENRRVRWDQDVVDNEGMGKKKSKVCCIYHRPRAYDESSSEDDSSDSSDDESSCGHGHGHGHRKNAYEKMPKPRK